LIRAMIFDLDGTLVRTEQLKAISYARAAIDLCPHALTEEEVIEEFKQVVGLSRREVALGLIERFGLEEVARGRMTALGVDTPWQAFVQIRLAIYEEMLADPEVIRINQWPHNIALLEEARRTYCKVGLATMSYCPQVQRVLEILALSDAFDFIASRDDVEHGKPDPEIYLLVAKELAVSPEECLVIEDSPSGVKAALAAGMWCIAVTTPFTQKTIHTERLLPEAHIVDNPDQLPGVVAHIIEQHEATGR
jgi:beta-phosphoglucomutase